MTDPEQHIVARLPSHVARRARSLTGPGKPYQDLAELIEVSVLNQLALEDSGNKSDGGGERRNGADHPLLQMPATPPRLLSVPQAAEPLSSFTNRLFPIKLSCRVLSNSAENVTLAEFQRMSAESARAIGLRLRDLDKRANRRGMERRWVALPVGAKGDSTINRFINHFTVTTGRDGRAHGPLVLLGLAGLDASGHPALSDLGWELAQSPNPVLDQEPAGEQILSDPERTLLARALASNPTELDAILSFSETINSAEGLQSAVDRDLMTTRDWSHDQAAAYRAAMIGRLHDLELAHVDGEGAEARIRVVADLLDRIEGAGHEG